MDSLTINVAMQTQPLTGAPSGLSFITTPLTQTLQLIQKSLQDFDLTNDSPYSVPLAQLTGVTFIYIVIATGYGVQPMIVKLSSSGAATQTIPVDNFLILALDSSNPITAITLTRPAGTELTGEIFIGQSQ